ncbi:MAG TPA: FAD-dependent oxidoreductase, partial [Myxococcota bacterium]|nr:FAD-dependent oxidoreductase [Myxococcota bacterium]
YTGMVPGHIAGHYALDEIAIDVAGLARRAGAELRLTSASLVSPEHNEVACADGSVVGYDVLSLDVGSQPAIGEAVGVERHAVVLRPLDNLVRGWDEALARAERGEARSFTVVGGGGAGIELALAMNRRLRAALAAPVAKVRLISDAAGGGLAPGAERRLRARMKRAGIDLHVGSPVAEVGAGFVRLASGNVFVTDAVFWATGAAAPGWIRDSGLATDKRGFLLTNDALQSVWHADVFGAGDCATQEGRDLAKAGVFAVRAAPVLAANLRSALHGGELRLHRPRANFLALVSAGERYAVGSWDGLAWQGRWAWLWKDRIDRRFVARYRGDGQ